MDSQTKPAPRADAIKQILSNIHGGDLDVIAEELGLEDETGETDEELRERLIVKILETPTIEEIQAIGQKIPPEVIRAVLEEK